MGCACRRPQQPAAAPGRAKRATPQASPDLRPRRASPHSTACASTQLRAPGASLAQEYSHDSGLAAPLLHGHSPAGAGGGPPSRLGSRQPSLAGPSAGPPGGYAPPQLAAAAAAAAAHDEALDDFPSAFPAAGAGAAILGSPSAGAGAAAAAKAFAAADAAAEAGARPSARVTGIIYGIINGVVGLPCMIGFAAVIFSVRGEARRCMHGSRPAVAWLAAARGRWSARPTRPGPRPPSPGKSRAAPRRGCRLGSGARGCGARPRPGSRGARASRPPARARSAGAPPPLPCSPAPPPQDPMYKPMLGDLARFSFLAAAVHQVRLATLPCPWLARLHCGHCKQRRPPPPVPLVDAPRQAALSTDLAPPPNRAAAPQTVFTLLSTIPFAVGQPQDVGLIFLSSMATGVAEIGREVRLAGASAALEARVPLRGGAVGRGARAREREGERELQGRAPL